MIFFSENRAVYGIMWKNIVQPDRPQKTIWRMRIVCWITKATNKGADKSFARPGRKQATATEDFEFHISYL